MEGQFNSILGETSAGYWEWDTTDDSFYVSPGLKQTMGYGEGDLMDTLDTFKMLLLPKHARSFLEKLQGHTRMGAGGPFIQKLHFLSKDRSIVEVVSTAWATKWGGDGGPQKIVGCNMSLPKSKRTKNGLIEDLFVEYNEGDQVGGWEVDLLTNKVAWTKITRHIHEVGDDYQPTLEEAFAFFEGGPLERLTAAFENLVANGTSFSVEAGITTAKGRSVLLCVKGYAVIAEGQCIRSYGTIEDVTDKKGSHEHSSVIFEESTNAHLLVDDSGILDCNNSAVKMIGCKNKAQLLSFHPSVFSPEFQPDGRRSDEKWIRMDKIVRERGINCFDWVHKRVDDGTQLLVEVTLNQIKVDGRPVLLVVWTDITERKRAEEKIKQSERLLNETQELTHTGSWEHDLQTGANTWSAEAFRIFGLEAFGPGPMTDGFLQMIHPDDMGLYTDAVKNTIQKRVSADFEMRIILLDGTLKWIRAIGRPFINSMGTVTKLHGAISDISREKEASGALKKAKELAEGAAVAKSQFLTTMSHEIRTPMNAVIGFTHLLMGNAREDQMEFLKILKFSGENLLVLINDILDFSKIEAGKIIFEERDFNLKELMGNIKAGLAHKARSKGLVLKLLIDGNAPDFVIGDSVRLSQIITNLASNAVKFTATGSVVISAVSSGRDGDFTTIHFEVRDTGIGIAKEAQEDIFESFTQASSDTTRKFGGTGLGLTITKRLLELMGSKINVKSSMGEGSAFYFDLRLKNGTARVTAGKNPVPRRGHDLRHLRLLIVDDNRMNILLAQQLLLRWEGRCDVAENGLEALELVQKNDYDLVLMDLQMPEMDGYRATEEIRKLEGEKYKKLPIIALTASAMLEIKDRALASGMNGYISKPFNPEELYRKITEYAGN